MSAHGRSEALAPQRAARRLNDCAAGPLPRRSLPLGGAGAPRRRGHQ